MFRAFLQALGILGMAFLLLTALAETPPTPPSPPSLAAVSNVFPTAPHATPTPSVTSVQTPATSSAQTIEAPLAAASPAAAPLPQGFSWGALVNILCTQTTGTVRPISGSGVLIDPRGVILTNAHVAQFILLASQEHVRLSCVVRTGSPAAGSWTATLLYMPKAWVDEHAADIKKASPLGTGENDYAFLLITGSRDGSPLPKAFPYVPINTGPIAKGDQVLLAAYPAEFTDATATENALKASPAITTVRQLLTFKEATIDAISLGGVLVAQAGSSGGAVLNNQGKLIGIISTTSDGDTTTERDLRAITLAYINRSLTLHTGAGIPSLLSGDIQTKASDFRTYSAPVLGKQIIDHLR